MIGLGTIVNVGTVLIGTTIGILLKNGLPKRFEKTVMQGLGLTTCFIGIGGTLSEVLTIQDGEIGTQHTMLLILCLALGAVIGEALNIEQRLEDFGAFCQSHFAAKGDSRFVEGFVTASLLFCVGAMSIVGALNDGLNGDPTMLIAKAILDGVASILFAASLGKGVYLSVVPIFFYQGGITLMARFIRPWLTDVLIGQMSCVGSVLIFAISLNLIFNSKLRVGNLLPAIFLPVLFFFLARFFPALGTL